ncbi:MAG TPA: TetR/AcrR family transcriptional regulator [Solirubrobacteraceae bacterium]|nr:TetR/AcrR family transcriptional regulator [Solirubrobacteraceae bacterium]
MGAPSRGVGTYPHGRVPASVRSEQLLDVAERLFAARGYGATSIESIAREAGVTRPIVYKRFGPKDEVYLACLRRARAQMESALVEAVAGAEGLEDQIRRAADAYFRFLEADPARWRVLFGGDAAVSGPVAEEAMQMHLATEQRFADLFAIGNPERGEHELLAFSHAVGGAAHQLAQWWLRTPEISREQIVAWYFAVVWEGLAGVLGRN